MPQILDCRTHEPKRRRSPQFSALLFLKDLDPIRLLKTALGLAKRGVDPGLCVASTTED